MPAPVPAGDGHRPSLAPPAFPDDDGAVDPDLGAALAAHGVGGGLAPVLAALGTARVVVPVVATLGAAPTTAAEGDKDADMAAVLLTGADGRRALLAFSGLATLQAWRPDARPVAVPGSQACAAAVAEGAAALVVDLAGPHRAVVEGEDLRRLAAGERLVETAAGHGWVQVGRS